MSIAAQKLLSIIIVNFETPKYTISCIESIYINQPHCSFEIILIDNGSKDDSLEEIRSAFPDVICIETGENLGFARANNLGISNARGQYILLLNSDTKILDNSLNGMLECLLSNPAVGAVGPKQLDGQGKLQLSWGSFPTLTSEVFRKLFHHRLSMNDLKIRGYLEEKYSGMSEVGWISGSCLMARREALYQAGLLDPHFFMYFEDIDLCRRIQDAGWKINFQPNLTIIHYGGVSAKKNILRVLVEYRRSQLYFTRKYYGLRGVLALRWLLFVKYILFLANDGFAFLVCKMLGQNVKDVFARLLLSKKSLELICGMQPESASKG